jgi:hypothetical protein
MKECEGINSTGRIDTQKRNRKKIIKTGKN